MGADLGLAAESTGGQRGVLRDHRAVCLRWRGAVRVLKHEFFARLGRLSYSIYLTHLAVLFFVISAFMVVQKKTGFEAAPMLGDIRYLDTGHVWLNDLLLLLILAVVVTISSATYHYVELRGQAVGRQLLRRRVVTSAR